MIAVLGGGISGLSVAHGLKKAGKDFMLLESSMQLGGKIQSREKNGFTLELGPNTVLLNNGEIKTLIKDLKLEDELIFADHQAVKNRQVLFNGEVTSLPSSPLQLIRSKLFSFRSLFQLIKEPFIDAKIEFEDDQESLADFSRRRLGIEIYENFIYPFVTGIYAGNPEKMSMDFTLKMLKEAEQRHGSILKGMIKLAKEKRKINAALKLPKQKIFSFRNGLQRLIQKLEEELADHILYEAKIERIVKTPKGYLLVYWNNNELIKKEVQQVVSTIPSYSLAQAVNWDIEFSESLRSINYVPAFASHFSIKTKSENKQKPLFGILSREKESAPFLGVLFNSHFFPHTAPDGHELITVISGGYKQAHYLQKTDEEIQEMMVKYIKSLLNWDTEPEINQIYRWKRGIPQYNLGHDRVVEEIEEFESQNKGFYVLGNFRDGISVSDCVKSGLTLAENIK